MRPAPRGTGNGPEPGVVGGHERGFNEAGPARDRKREQGPLWKALFRPLLQ